MFLGVIFTLSFLAIWHPWEREALKSIFTWIGNDKHSAWVWLTRLVMAEAVDGRVSSMDAAEGRMPRAESLLPSHTPSSSSLPLARYKLPFDRDSIHTSRLLPSVILLC